jgi:molybdopterin-containing oxidoreductase family membrane subunit
MDYVSEPRDFGEVARRLLALWRAEGTFGFARTVWNLGHGRSPQGAMWKLGLAAAGISLAFVFYQLFTVGHAAFNTSSDGVNWGMAISTYAFLALTSSGLTFIASMSMVFGFKAFYPIAKRCIWLAIITLGAGFTVLALELGHPFRMLWSMPTGLQVLSPMFWMGVFYSIDLVLLLIKFYLLWQEEWDTPRSHAVGIAGFVAVVLASGMLGLVFGSMVMRPMWYGSFTSIYFMITAALSGAAAIVLTTYMAYGLDATRMPPALRSLATGHTMPHIFATLVGIVLVALGTRLWTGLWSNLDGLEGFHELVRSPLFHAEIWLGLVLPFALMLHPSLQRQPKYQVAAAALALAAMFIDRYVFIIGGQTVPMFKGTWMSGLTPYVPSLAEIALTFVGLGIILAAYALGEKLFNLSAVPPGGAKEEVPFAARPAAHG